MWVLHRGALGDSVLLWPVLRAHRARGRRAALVADGSKARLAAAEAGVIGLDAEGPGWSRLWVEGAAVEPMTGARLVIDAVGGGEVWRGNLAAMFPGARVVRAGRPTAARWLRRAARDSMPSWMPPLRRNPGGPVVLHVGAGSEAKRWPLERWLALAAVLRDGGRAVELIAGEVEAERLGAAERGALLVAGGRFLADLPSLAAILRSAALVVTADSGPGHLAAALGVPTLALFGPTDPRVWSPVGPAVRVLAPERAMGMGWLGVDRVLGAAGGVLV